MKKEGPSSLFLTRRYLTLFMGILSIALAFGWGKYVGQTVYLPQFDYLDVALGTITGGYLIWLWAADPRTATRNQKG